MTKESLKSNIVHAIAALAIQLPFGLAGYAEIGGAVAVGFFIGVEWMQQIRINLAEQGRPWPTELTIEDIILGFYWTTLDRYLDVVFPIIAVIGASYGY